MRQFSPAMILVVSCVALAPSVFASDAATTCRQLNLSPTAAGDCEQQLGGALTDADRAKVIRTFAVGLASARADALVSQLTASSSAPPAPEAGAKKANAAQAPATPATGTAATNQELATPQQKATTASGGQRTGTKAGPQKTQTAAPADQPAPTAKPKGQKTSHQPAEKNTGKTRQ